MSRYGFRTGENLVAEMRWVDEDTRGPQQVAAELARLPVDVLVVEGAEANLKAAVAAADTIPIVMSLGNYDPLARGYIKSRKNHRHIVSAAGISGEAGGPPLPSLSGPYAGGHFMG